MQSVTFHALRRGHWAQEIINRYVQKTPSGLTKYLLWAAIALFPEEEGQAMYPMHTWVNESVNATAQDQSTQYARGLVNAVLRRLTREQNIYAEVPEESYPAYPDWWLSKLNKAYGEHAKEIVKASRKKPPLTLRLNLRKLNRPELVLDYVKQCEQAGINLKPIASIGSLPLEGAYQVLNPMPVQDILGYAEGYFSVQDAGAQLAASLLAPAPGSKVLDACSAPGGKAMHLLELHDIELDALEIDPTRAERIHQSLDRLGYAAQVIVGDASELSTWHKGQQYDHILLDVPCSASGIVRRHPDIPYLRQEADIKNLQILQKKILTALWSTLKVGGKLLYVTCSVFPEEGEYQAQWWQAQMPNAVRLGAPGQLLPSDYHDGFFYALFEKTQ